MHQHQITPQPTPHYGTMPSTTATTIDKCDIWDGGDPDSEPHHRFRAGQVYPDERDDVPDRWKIKLHRTPFDESDLPGDVTGFELYCTDADGGIYAETITACSVRDRLVYAYIPQAQPAIFIP
jgi:hypothetical protein